MPPTTMAVRQGQVMLEGAQAGDPSRYLADLLPPEDDLLGLQLVDHDTYGGQAAPGASDGFSPFYGQGGADHGASLAMPISCAPGAAAGREPSLSGLPDAQQQMGDFGMPVGQSPGSTTEGSQHYARRPSSGALSSLFSSALSLSASAGADALPTSASLSASFTSSTGDIWGMGNGSGHGGNAYARLSDGGSSLRMQGVPEDDHTLHGGAAYGLSMRHSASGACQQPTAGPLGDRAAGQGRPALITRVSVGVSERYMLLGWRW